MKRFLILLFFIPITFFGQIIRVDSYSNRQNSYDYPPATQDAAGLSLKINPARNFKNLFPSTPKLLIRDYLFSEENNIMFPDKEISLYRTSPLLFIHDDNPFRDNAMLLAIFCNKCHNNYKHLWEENSTDTYSFLDNYNSKEYLNHPGDMLLFTKSDNQALSFRLNLRSVPLWMFFKKHYKINNTTNYMNEDGGVQMEKIPDNIIYITKDLNLDDIECSQVWEEIPGKRDEKINCMPSKEYFFHFNGDSLYSIYNKASFIFNNDTSTKLIIKNPFDLKEISEHGKLINSLKKYPNKPIHVELSSNRKLEYKYKLKVRPGELHPRDNPTLYYNNYSSKEELLKNLEPNETNEYFSFDKNIYLKFYYTSTPSFFNKILEKTPPSKKNSSSYEHNLGLANTNPFNLEKYIDKFIEDAKQHHDLDLSYVNNEDKEKVITFKDISELNEDDNKTLAVALGKDDDNVVLVVVDPENWKNASPEKRWYIIYHELGHDILNLEHGECGPMMNENITEKHNWSILEKDKILMFKEFKLKNKKSTAKD